MASVMAKSTLRDLKDLEAAVEDDNSVKSENSESAFDSSTTTKTPTNGDKSQNQSSESSTLARAETRAVNRSKMVVLFMLCVAAAGVGAATFVFARNSETKEFENKVRKNSPF